MQFRLTVVAWLGAMALAACASNVPPSSSLPTASPLPASAQLPTASPSASPWPLVTPSPPPSATASPEPLPLTLALPVHAVHTLPNSQPSATYGSRTFTGSAGDRFARGSLTMGDLATEATATLATLATLAKGHGVDGVAATADYVVWVEIWRDHPSPPNNLTPGCVDVGKPLRWRISALTLATRRRSLVASGTNIRIAVGGECADVNPPVIAADGDRVAYTLEAASSANPAANRIVVRSRTDGKKIRSVTSTGLVRDLVLDGQAVAYRDTATFERGSDTVDPNDGRLMVLADDAAKPNALDQHVNSVGMGGGRIAWARNDATDGSVWTTTLGSGQKLHVTGLAAPDFVADSAGQIAVSDGVIAWIVNGLEGDIVNTSRLAGWLSGDPGARYVTGFQQPDYVGITGGWLVWDSTLGVPGSKWPAGLYGIPITDLSAQ